MQCLFSASSAPSKSLEQVKIPGQMNAFFPLLPPSLPLPLSATAAFFIPLEQGNEGRECREAPEPAGLGEVGIVATGWMESSPHSPLPCLLKAQKRGHPPPPRPIHPCCHCPHPQLSLTPSQQAGLA